MKESGETKKRIGGCQNDWGIHQQRFDKVLEEHVSGATIVKEDNIQWVFWGGRWLGGCQERQRGENRYVLDGTMGGGTRDFNVDMGAQGKWLQDRVCTVIHDTAHKASIISDGPREGSDQEVTLVKLECWRMVL